MIEIEGEFPERMKERFVEKIEEIDEFPDRFFVPDVSFFRVRRNHSCFFCSGLLSSHGKKYFLSFSHPEDERMRTYGPFVCFCCMKKIVSEEEAVRIWNQLRELEKTEKRFANS